jgi:hypothetical protein
MTIQDTNVVTPLRPVTDPTGPIRSRRARQKRKEAASPVNTGDTRIYKNRNEIKGSDTVPASKPDASTTGIPWSVWPLAATTVGLMAVSLTHLSDGVTQLTAIPT